jgi:hypothetical protein
MFFCILKVTEDFGTDPHQHPDPLVRDTDPRIRIRIKMPRIREKKKFCVLFKTQISIKALSKCNTDPYFCVEFIKTGHKDFKGTVA